MFSFPKRSVDEKGNTVFHVDVNKGSFGFDTYFELSESRNLVGTLEYQQLFKNFQKNILSDLSKEKALFKHPPLLESLEALSPNWGFIILNGQIVWSPYCKLQFHESLMHAQLPCYVNLTLVAIEITRSSIYPIFECSFVKSKIKDEIIDFTWDQSESSDLLEVTDVPDMEEGIIELANPAKRIREKIEAKERVHNAFLEAKQARIKARELADAFLEKYDVSDSESCFTEWMSESDED
jgi:hypothetical protein